MEKKLERNQYNKMIAGVASGLADYLSVDVTLVRIAFVLSVLFHFAGIPVYIILWIAIPEKSFFKDFPSFDTDYRVPVPEEQTVINPEPNQMPFQPIEKNKTPLRIVFGLILIGLGCWYMLAEFGFIPDWFSIFKLWPLILIGLGVVILAKSGKKKVNWTDEHNNSANDNIDNQP